MRRFLVKGVGRQPSGLVSTAIGSVPTQGVPHPLAVSAPSSGATGGSSSAAAGGDVVPLLVRVTVISVVRVLAGAVLLLVAQLSDQGLADRALTSTIGYLLLAGLLSVGVLLIRHRVTAIGALGVVLCLDGMMLETAQYHFGPTAGVQATIGIYLVTICLLSSFRTGIKLVIWQSLLIGIVQEGMEDGLFTPHQPTGVHPFLTELLTLWMLVLVACTGAAVSERELRRRRYDAEKLQTFAAALHADDEPSLVYARTLRFVVDELNAGRALVCRRQPGGLEILSSHGLTGDRAAAGLPGISALPHAAATNPEGESLLLARSQRPGLTTLLLRLDPQSDPWLYSVLPDARRLVVLPLGDDLESSPVWVVFEHRHYGRRVERRMLSTVGQLNSTAVLAFSRAVLFQQTHTQATTDALTKLANRRTFDLQLARLVAGLPATSFVVVLADVDRFKSVNDTHGHQMGDQVLQAVASTLKAHAPDHALVARYGGEEFGVLLPGADAATGLMVTEQLRAAVERSREPLAVTASFGVSAATANGDPGRLLAAADEALYWVKEHGRNGVRLADAVRAP